MASGGSDLVTELDRSHERLTTPRAAAVAGILFSLLLMTSLVMIRITVPASLQDAGAWLSSGAKTVTLAVHLMPFAGIAFLWFIGVLRDRLGAQEDKFFATVFFGSGLLFLATLFAFAGVAGGVLRMFTSTPDLLMVPGLYAFGRTVSYEIMNVYTMRMAGVFMISTSALSLRTGIVPRWMALLGFVLALFLLLSLGSIDWAPFVFPLWVLLISVYVLFANLGSPRT
jgi:hypothetical protein